MVTGDWSLLFERVSICDGGRAFVRGARSCAPLSLPRGGNMFGGRKPRMRDPL